MERGRGDVLHFSLVISSFREEIEPSLPRDKNFGISPGFRRRYVHLYLSQN